MRRGPFFCPVITFVKMCTRVDGFRSVQVALIPFRKQHLEDNGSRARGKGADQDIAKGVLSTRKPFGNISAKKKLVIGPKGRLFWRDLRLHCSSPRI
jgi:hypothetical protein